MNKRQELEVEYQKCIDQVAQFHLANKPIEVNAVLRKIEAIQLQMRNLDIITAVNEKTNQMKKATM